MRSKEAYGLDLIMIGLLTIIFAALASLSRILSPPASGERRRLASKIDRETKIAATVEMLTAEPTANARQHPRPS